MTITAKHRYDALAYLQRDLDLPIVPPIQHTLSKTPPRMMLGENGVVRIVLYKRGYYSFNDFPAYVFDLAHELRHVWQNLTMDAAGIHWNDQNYSIARDEYLTLEGHDKSLFEIDAERYARETTTRLFMVEKPEWLLRTPQMS